MAPKMCQNVGSVFSCSIRVKVWLATATTALSLIVVLLLRVPCPSVFLVVLNLPGDLCRTVPLGRSVVPASFDGHRS